MMVKSTKHIPARGAGEFFVRKLSKLESGGLGGNRSKVLIHSNRKVTLALIHMCENFMPIHEPMLSVVWCNSFFMLS